MSADGGLLQLAALAGTLAGLLSTGALLPQIWRILQRRSAADVSLLMYLTIVVAGLLWSFYGWANGSVVVVVSNLAIATLALAIVVLKLRFGRGGPKS